MSETSGNALIRVGRVGCGLVLLVSIVLELIFFPAIENFYGCLMSAVALSAFMFVFTEKYAVNYPFSFFALVPLFLYRFLPLPATLLEWKPVSYGMQVPFWTFIGESFLFVEVVAAFYFACQTGERRNNFLRKILNSFGVYNVPDLKVIWGLGGIGMFCYMYSLFSGMVIGTTGSIGNVLMSFVFLKDAPMLLLFPALVKMGEVNKSRIFVVVYFLFQLIVTLAANSRHMIIAPILLFVFLWTLNSIRERRSISNLLPFWKFGAIAILGYFLMGVLSDVSVAMLYTRALRSDVSRQELLKETYSVFLDKDLLKQLRLVEKVQREGTVQRYEDGWTEDYLDNFLLNRFCNVRVTDIGLYYASRMDPAAGDVLIKEYFGRALAMLPSVFIGSGGVKDYLNYSPGDRIYALAIGNESSIGSRVVISDLADGWATFGSVFFLYYFFLRYAFFKLLNSLVYVDGKGNLIYSAIGLILLYDIFLGQTNINGSIGVLYYCLRTLWQYVALWLICVAVVGLFVRSLRIFGRGMGNG